MSISKSLESKIKVNDIEILVLKKNIKNFHLNVLPPDGRVRISVPTDTTDEAVKTFAITRLPWIRKQIKNFEGQERQTERQYISGESHYFKGNRYLLNLVHHNSPAKIEIRNKKYLDFYVSPTHTVTQKEKVMMDWYRKELKKEIPSLIDKRKKVVGVEVDDREVKRMKTVRWTSNVEDKRIRLNLELAKKPQECLEYIIVHEMVHFLERTHNDKFISYMNKFMPKRKLYKSELNSEILWHEKW